MFVSILLETDKIYRPTIDLSPHRFDLRGRFNGSDLRHSDRTWEAARRRMWAAPTFVVRRDEDRPQLTTGHADFAQ